LTAVIPTTTSNVSLPATWYPVMSSSELSTTQYPEHHRDKLEKIPPTLVFNTPSTAPWYPITLTDDMTMKTKMTTDMAIYSMKTAQMNNITQNNTECVLFRAIQQFIQTEFGIGFSPNALQVFLVFINILVIIFVFGCCGLCFYFGRIFQLKKKNHSESVTISDPPKDSITLLRNTFLTRRSSSSDNELAELNRPYEHRNYASLPRRIGSIRRVNSRRSSLSLSRTRLPTRNPTPAPPKATMSTFI
jgi:hypothetical protein